MVNYPYYSNYVPSPFHNNFVYLKSRQIRVVLEFSKHDSRFVGQKFYTILWDFIQILIETGFQAAGSGWNWTLWHYNNRQLAPSWLVHFTDRYWPPYIASNSNLNFTININKLLRLQFLSFLSFLKLLGLYALGEVIKVMVGFFHRELKVLKFFIFKRRNLKNLIGFDRKKPFLLEESLFERIFLFLFFNLFSI